MDPKTVGRWLAGTTTPYPRHRATIARALDLPQHQLWPDETAPPTIAPRPAASDAAAGSDVTGTWAYDTDATAPDPAAFISATAGPIDYLDNGRGIAPTRDLIHALIDQATAGRPVRLATDLPERQYELLIGHPHIEIRGIEAGPSHSLLRVGDVALATLNLSVEGDQPPPLLKLQRTVDGGLFDRLVANLDTIWDNAAETLTTIQQLNYYVRDEHDWDDDEDDTGADEPTAIEPTPPSAPPAAPTSADDDEPERRWPRRPS